MLLLHQTVYQGSNEKAGREHSGYGFVLALICVALALIVASVMFTPGLNRRLCLRVLRNMLVTILMATEIAPNLRRWSRGSDPRLLRLTLDRLPDHASGERPRAIQGSSISQG
jgi:hypothetical protein